MASTSDPRNETNDWPDSIAASYVSMSSRQYRTCSSDGVNTRLTHGSVGREGNEHPAVPEFETLGGERIENVEIELVQRYAAHGVRDVRGASVEQNLRSVVQGLEPPGGPLEADRAVDVALGGCQGAGVGYPG